MFLLLNLYCQENTKSRCLPVWPAVGNTANYFSVRTPDHIPVRFTNKTSLELPSTVSTSLLQRTSLRWSLYPGHLVRFLRSRDHTPWSFSFVNFCLFGQVTGPSDLLPAQTRSSKPDSKMWIKPGWEKRICHSETGENVHRSCCANSFARGRPQRTCHDPYRWGLHLLP